MVVLAFFFVWAQSVCSITHFSEQCKDNNEACVHRVTQVLGQGIDPNSIANNQEEYMASLHRAGMLS